MTGSEREKRKAGVPEHRWPALIAIVVAVVTYALLPPNVEVIPRWIVPLAAALLLVPLLIVNPSRFTREKAWSRWLSIGFAFGLAIVNQLEVVIIVSELLTQSSDA